MHREGIAKTCRERAVVSPQMLVLNLFRTISRQPSEHLAVGRRFFISRELFLSEVYHGGAHYGPEGGLFVRRSSLPRRLP